MQDAPLSLAEIQSFRDLVLRWYRVHRRDLPWRRTRDPYRIWVSEIMLQQTRVGAVLEHYRRFLERFPDVASLAAASEPEVLAIWSGLGYYRRARMLHRAAQSVVAEHAGVMPETAAGLRELPGIGAYTSAAIASIAYDEPLAAVDGNVERVLARVAGWSAAEPGFAVRLAALAGALVDPDAAGDYNQAMMELGATVCLPRRPRCLDCPVLGLCRTRGEHVPALRKPMEVREIAYLLCTREGPCGPEVLLEQRAAEASLMAGMWELPGTPVRDGQKAWSTVRHAITTTNYTVRVYRGEQELKDAEKRQAERRAWYPLAALLDGGLTEIALTGLARKILRRAAVEQAAPEEVSANQECAVGRRQGSLRARAYLQPPRHR